MSTLLDIMTLHIAMCNTSLLCDTSEGKTELSSLVGNHQREHILNTMCEGQIGLVHS